MKVWIVSEGHFEGDIITNVCASKTLAVKYWEEMRDEMIKDNERMVKHCIESEYNDSDKWQNYITELQNLKPGDTPEECYDYPKLEEWECEE